MILGGVAVGNRDENELIVTTPKTLSSRLSLRSARRSERFRIGPVPQSDSWIVKPLPFAFHYGVTHHPIAAPNCSDEHPLELFASSEHSIENKSIMHR